MKVKLDRDESLIYFVESNPLLATRWLVELTKSELASFKKCEREYFEWQERLEKMCVDET